MKELKRRGMDMVYLLLCVPMWQEGTRRYLVRRARYYADMVRRGTET